MPNPGRIRITKNSNLTTPLIDYRGALSNFIAWDGQFQITEFANDDYIEYDFEENEWYFNLYATLPGTNLSNLLDVNLSTLVDLDVLVYDILTGKWVNSDKLHTAIQNIAGIENEIATINQTNIDQQTSIDALINSTSGSAGGSIPEGGIIMWSGTTVPDDWVLCDGDNSTPDLVDRFIIGDDMNSIGGGGSGSPTSNTVAAQDLTIAIANLPKHVHGAGTLQPKANGHTELKANWDSAYSGLGQSNGSNIGVGGNPDWSGQISGGMKWPLSIDGDTGNGGYDNIPLEIVATAAPKKYYKLAFIMRRAGFINTVSNPWDVQFEIPTFADPVFDDEARPPGTQGTPAEFFNNEEFV